MTTDPPADTPSTVREEGIRRLDRGAAGWRLGLPGVFWTVLATSSLARLAFFVVPFLAFYLADARHLSDGEITTVMTCFGVGWTVAGPVGGWLADRFGRRAPLVLGACGAASSYLLLASAHGIVDIALFASLAGLTFDLYRPAVTAIIADRVPVASQPQAFRLWYLVVFNAAGAAGTIGGGFLATQYGYTILFVVDAAANLCFAIAVLSLIPASPPNAGKRTMFWRTALRDPSLVGFTAVSLITMTVYAQTTITLPTTFAGAGISPLGFGLISAANPCVVIVLQPVLRLLAVTRNPQSMCAASVATIGIGVALTGLGHGIVWYLSTTAIWTLGEAVYMTFAPVIVAAIAPPQARGIYAGVWQTAMGGAMLLGPVCGGGLLTLGGPQFLWPCCAAAGVLAALGCRAIAASDTSAFVWDGAA